MVATGWLCGWRYAAVGCLYSAKVPSDTACMVGGFFLERNGAERIRHQIVCPAKAFEKSLGKCIRGLQQCQVVMSSD